MENLALQIIDEEIHNQRNIIAPETETYGEESEFIIDNDVKAEWALNKIREEQAESQRMIMVCESIINTYQNKILIAKRREEMNTSLLRSMLQQYFETVPKKATKTQETYQLPSGKLKKKFGTLDYIRDDEQIMRYLKNTEDCQKYIKTKETIDWAEFKKSLAVYSGEAVDTFTGEVVPGIKVEVKPDKFEIEL